MEKKKKWNRSEVITSADLNNILLIYNGKDFKEVFITEKMVGHRLGEFAFTRKMLSNIHTQKKKKKKNK